MFLPEHICERGHSMGLAMVMYTFSFCSYVLPQMLQGIMVSKSLFLESLWYIARAKLLFSVTPGVLCLRHLSVQKIMKQKREKCNRKTEKKQCQCNFSLDFLLYSNHGHFLYKYVFINNHMLV
jgi:hypothetical protein